MNEQMRLASIKELKARTRRDLAELKKLQRIQDDLEEDRVVKSLGITIDDVELSKADETKPWFREITEFIDWCKKNSSKPYLEWNESIYPMGFERWNQKITSLQSVERNSQLSNCAKKDK